MIVAHVEGFQEVARTLRASGSGAQRLVEQMVMRLTFKLATISVRDKLSGQVLKRRTGTLARSVQQSPRTFMVGTDVVGTVGVANITGPGGRAPVKYAAVHEFGFKGTENVREHMRTVKQAFGRPLATPVQSPVKAHSRKVDIPERSFLRSALRDLEAQGVIDTELARTKQEIIK
jgi:phage gpG-like protein